VLDRGTPRADAGPDVAEEAVESSAAVDRQAAHRGCGQQAAHTKPTFPPPDGFDEEDDGYVASLLLANDVWTRHKGGDFRWPQVGTFTWPCASGAGDGLRTRYLNLGNKAFKNRIQASSRLSCVYFIRLYSKRLEFVSSSAVVGSGRARRVAVTPWLL